MTIIRLVSVGVLGVATLLVATGCNTGKLRDERASLLAQNQQLEQQLAAERAAAEAARARAAALQGQLASRPVAPATAPASELAGIPGVRQYTTEQGEEAIELAGDITFDLAKATIKPQFTATLDRVAEVIKTKYPERKLRIEGHTDRLPIRHSGWEDNWDLGAARARSVALYLMSRGVPKNSIYIASFADTEPKSTTELAPNRRVEIVVTR